MLTEPGLGTEHHSQRNTISCLGTDTDNAHSLEPRGRKRRGMRNEDKLESAS